MYRNKIRPRRDILAGKKTIIYTHRIKCLNSSDLSCIYACWCMQIVGLELVLVMKLTDTY